VVPDVDRIVSIANRFDHACKETLRKEEQRKVIQAYDTIHGTMAQQGALGTHMPVTQEVLTAMEEAAAEATSVGDAIRKMQGTLAKGAKDMGRMAGKVGHFGHAVGKLGHALGRNLSSHIIVGADGEAIEAPPRPKQFWSQRLVNELLEEE
jgi:hypothetical protein